MFVKSGSPVPSVPVSNGAAPEVRDVEWFKKRHEDLGFCALQLAWKSTDWFRAVLPHLMDLYFHHLEKHKRLLPQEAHEQALALAQGDYEAALLHPWNVLGE